MLTGELKLRRLIREFILFEKNQQEHFKKPLDCEIVIAQIDQEKMCEIYDYFNDNSIEDKDILNISASDEGADRFEEISIDSDSEEVKDAFKNSRYSSIELKKSDSVIEALTSVFKFNFKNCDLSENCAIVCVKPQPGNFDKFTGISFDSSDNYKSQIKNQKFEDLDEMNWFLHDLHHHQSGIESSGYDNLSSKAIAGEEGVKKIKNKYNVDKSGKEGIASHIKDKSALYRYDSSGYWIEVIGLFFRKIKYTSGVGSRDIWASIYSFCLNKMSKPEDAFRINFRIVNDPKDSSKRTLVSPTENKNLQQFFKICKETVDKNSKISRVKKERIYIWFV